MDKELVVRLEAAVARLEALLVTGSRALPTGHTADEPAAVDPAIAAFDELLVNYLGRLSAAADKIGGPVQDVTKILAEAFAVLKELLIKAKQCQKPDRAGLEEFLKPLNEVILRANDLAEGRRPAQFFNHLKAAADSLRALAWVAYLGKDCGVRVPISHVEESWEMARFYNNKILMEYRTKHPNHIEWAKALEELYLPGLRDYVKSFFPLGIWGSAGVAVVYAPGFGSFALKDPWIKKRPSAAFQGISSAKSLASVVSAPRSGSSEAKDPPVLAAFAPPPPPPPPPRMKKRTPADFRVISSTESLTSATKNGAHSISSSFLREGPPDWSFKWVTRKVDNIIVDKCIKTGVVFIDVVAACEVVNCNGVEVHCQRSAPTISIDNTFGCQLYLSKDSLGASITTAQSSQINVLVPGAGNDWLGGYFVEEIYMQVAHALPKQLVHTFEDGKFTTSPVSHSGG